MLTARSLKFVYDPLYICLDKEILTCDSQKHGIQTIVEQSTFFGTEEGLQPLLLFTKSNELTGKAAAAAELKIKSPN